MDGIVTAIAGVVAGLLGGAGTAWVAVIKARASSRADTLQQAERFSQQLLDHQTALREESNAIHAAHQRCEERLGWLTGRVYHLEELAGVAHGEYPFRPPEAPATDPGFLKRTNEQDAELLREKAEHLKPGATPLPPAPEAPHP